MNFFAETIRRIRALAYQLPKDIKMFGSVFAHSASVQSGVLEEKLAKNLLTKILNQSLNFLFFGTRNLSYP